MQEPVWNEPVWNGNMSHWPPEGWYEQRHVERFDVAGWRIELEHVSLSSHLAQMQWAVSLYNLSASETVPVGYTRLDDQLVHHARSAARVWAVEYLRKAADVLASISPVVSP